MVHADDHLAGDARGCRTTRGAAPSMMIAVRRDEEQQAVGGRVEDLAELGHLVEVAGDVAVDPVGGAEHAEQPRRAAPRLSRPNSSQRNSGRQHRRTRVITFGTVR